MQRCPGIPVQSVRVRRSGVKFSNPIRHVAIFGGGTAKSPHDGVYRIELVESWEIGTVGIDGATIPPIGARPMTASSRP